MHIGRVSFPGGRISEPATYGLSDQLREYGFAVGRMKTGTPVRIDGRSIDFSKLTRQDGDNDFHKFSFLSFAYTNSLEKDLAILPIRINAFTIFDGKVLMIVLF